MAEIAGGRVGADEVVDALSLGIELIGGLVHSIAEPIVKDELLLRDKVPVPIAVGADGARIHKALRDTIRVAVRSHSRAEPVPAGSGEGERAHGVSNGDGSGGAGRAAPLLDDGGATVLDFGREVRLEPLLVDDVHCRLAGDAGVYKVGDLGGRRHGKSQ